MRTTRLVLLGVSALVAASAWTLQAQEYAKRAQARFLSRPDDERARVSGSR
jgi:hypothetical protein